MREFLVSNKHIVINAISSAALAVAILKAAKYGIDGVALIFVPMAFYGFLMTILNKNNFGFSLACAMFTVFAALLI